MQMFPQHEQTTIMVPAVIATQTAPTVVPAVSQTTGNTLDVFHQVLVASSVAFPAALAAATAFAATAQKQQQQEAGVATALLQKNQEEAART